MKRSIRSVSASSLISRKPCGSALEADEPADKGVVARVRGIAVTLAQEKIEPLLRIGQRRRDRQTETTEPGGADRDKERFGRLNAALEITNAPPDEVFAGQSSGLRTFLHESNSSAEGSDPCACCNARPDPLGTLWKNEVYEVGDEWIGRGS